jgi:hypothetical protein
LKLQRYQNCSEGGQEKIMYLPALLSMNKERVVERHYEALLNDEIYAAILKDLQRDIKIDH